LALSRNYNIDTGTTVGGWIPLGTASGTTEYGLIYGAAAANYDYNISAVRIAIASGGSASYPTNGSITFRLRRSTSTVSATFVGTGTAAYTGPGTLTASSAWIYGTASSAGTGTLSTPGAVLWSQTIPYTAGANWAEWFTPGFELNSGAGGTIALTYAFDNGTSSATFCIPEFVISE